MIFEMRWHFIANQAVCGECRCRRDLTMQEATMRMTTGNMGNVMASINKFVLALICQAKFQNAAQARRWFAAHLS